MAIIDHFDRGWSINPDGIAYIQDERSFTFTEAGELSCRAIAAIRPQLPKVKLWVCVDGDAHAAAAPGRRPSCQNSAHSPPAELSHGILCFL